MLLLPAGVVGGDGGIGVDFLRGEREEQVARGAGLEHSPVVGAANGVHCIEVDAPTDEVPPAVRFARQFLGTLLENSRAPAYFG